MTSVIQSMALCHHFDIPQAASTDRGLRRFSAASGITA